MKNKKANKKIQINIKKLIILVLSIYLIASFSFYIINQPIRNIVIRGTYLVSDIEIIRAADIAHFPSIIRTRPRTLENRIQNIDIVESVTVRRDLRFRLIIEVEEAKIIFHNANNNQVMLSSGRYIEANNRLPSIPTLINFAPEAVLTEFAKNLGTLDYGVLSLISEIEYSPMISSEGLTIDDTRFILYMNDGNHVFVNASRARNLRYYPRIFASLQGVQGILYLDGANNHHIFRDFETMSNNQWNYYYIAAVPLVAQLSSRN